MVSRLTIPTRLVLEVLTGAPDDEVYGLEIGRASGLPSGTVHPILARLEGLGWLTSRWEDIDPVAAGRPPRRYYRLTGPGRVEATARLAQGRARLRPTGQVQGVRP